MNFLTRYRGPNGLGIACVTALQLALLGLACKPKPAPAPLPPPSATTTTTAPATTQAVATKPGPPRSYMELVKLAYPDSPATQPLDTPLDRKDAARIVLREPIYLDRLQNLWITRPDAEPAQAVLGRAEKETEHLVRQTPLFVHWRYDPGDKRNAAKTTAVMVCPGVDGLEFVEERRRVTVPAKSTRYNWADAFSWNDNVVVGHATGASVFVRSDSGWEEIASPKLIDEGTPHAPTQVPVDVAGLIAYVPAENGQAGSEQTARFVDGKWSVLEDEKKWPPNLLHLIPLADGSVLQLIAEPEGRVRLAFTDFNDAKVDPGVVKPLIEQLDDAEVEKRQEAYRALSTYGTALWPVLEKEMDNQPAGVQEKLRQLLKNKTDPTLGEMSLVDSRMKLAARTPDGGALFYAKGGVSVVNVDGDQDLVAPAWVSARPGTPVRLMIGSVWADLTPTDKRFYAVGGGDWIISDEVQGPREMIGTFDLQPMLRKNEAKYSEFVGVDRRGRWLFREPEVAATTGNENATTVVRQTLIVDPNLPPVKPRLPVWEFSIKDGATGCDEGNWPAYRDKAGNIWVINEEGFQLLDMKKHQFISEAMELQKLPNTVKDAPPVMAPAATAPSTTRAATAPTSRDGSAPILTFSDGTKLYGGQTALRRVEPGGRSLEWALPANAQGSVKAWLVGDKDGRFFLFNEPGRVVRLRFTDDPAEPLAVVAVFAHKIPNSEPKRMWIDPANRLVFAYDDDKLAICFPAGVIPQAIAEKMPAGDRDEDDE